MPNYEETVDKLNTCYDNISALKRALQELLNNPVLPKANKDEMQLVFERQLKEFEASKRIELEKLVMFPPHKNRHFQGLTDFEVDGSFDKSVFIMTKFPASQNQQVKDKELQDVIDEVKKAISAKGYVPRIALGGKKYHAGLWDNVEMFLMGCKRAIAIVEDKYQNELNPNVTMEWGWMRGMNRDVLYLVEDSFDLGRADIAGLIQDKFDWANPRSGVENAIGNWLP